MPRFNPLSQPQGIGLKVAKDAVRVPCQDCGKAVFEHDAVVAQEKPKKWLCCDCADRRAYFPGHGSSVYAGHN